MFLTAETGGSSLIEALLTGSTEIYFVHPSYSKFNGKLEFLGIKSKINLHSGTSDTCTPYVEQQIRDNADRRIGRRLIYIFPKNDFKPNTNLPYLREILASMTKEKSLVLFRWLASKEDCIKGIIEWNTNRQNATSGTSQHGTLEVFSEFAYRLWNADWIYGKDGRPCIPRKLSFGTIDEAYLEHQELLEMFGVSGVKTHKLSAIVAENVDISDGLRASLDIIGSMTDEEQREFCETYGKKKQSTKSIFEAMLNQNKEDYSIYDGNDDDDELHPSPVINPEKRSQSVRDELQKSVDFTKDKEKAETEETNLKIRRILNKASSKDEKAFLESLGSALNSRKVNYGFSESTVAERAFLQQEYEGRCQICGTRIRKALPRGSKQFPYHFIARNVIKTGDLNDIYKSTQVIDGWNSLSLCPMCAAKYLYCSKNLNGFIDQVMKIKIRPRVPEIFEISIMLDGVEEKIYYTPKHMSALQTALDFFMKHDEEEQSE